MIISLLSSTLPNPARPCITLDWIYPWSKTGTDIDGEKMERNTIEIWRYGVDRFTREHWSLSEKKWSWVRGLEMDCGWSRVRQGIWLYMGVQDFQCEMGVVMEILDFQCEMGMSNGVLDSQCEMGVVMGVLNSQWGNAPMYIVLFLGKLFTLDPGKFKKTLS